MKSLLALLFFVSFAAKASPLMNVKDRLRLHLWVQGLETKEVTKKQIPRPLPEELERALRKI